jgi:malonate transporter and related proteins
VEGQGIVFACRSKARSLYNADAAAWWYTAALWELRSLRSATLRPTMNHALLLLPDFLLIACGFVLCRYSALNRSVWDAAERLVYYLLFPVLLFNSIVRNPLQPTSMLSLAGCGLAVVGVGIVLSYALAGVPGVDRRLHASGAQTAFRFNSYVGLALAERVAGAQGVACIAVLVSLAVPLCNVARQRPWLSA